MWRLIGLIGLVLTACGKNPQVTPAPAPETEYKFALEALAPKDAVLVVSSTDWSKIVDLADENAWAGLFGSETARDFQLAIRAGWDRDKADTSDPFKGIRSISGCAVAFLQVQKEPNIATFSLVTESHSTQSGFTDFWNWLWARQIENADVSEEVIEGVQVRIASRYEHMAQFRTDTIEGMAVGRSKELVLDSIRGTLRRAQGELGDSITKTESFREAKKGRPSGSILSAFFDWNNFLPTIWDEAPEQNQTILTALQVSSFTWAAADFVLGKGEYWSLELRAPVQEDTLYDRVLGQTGSIPLAMFDSIPAESMGVLLCNVNVAKGIDEVRDFLSEALPKAVPPMDAGIASFQDEFGIGLRTDLLDRWTGDSIATLVPVPWRFPDYRRGFDSPLEFLALEYAPTAFFKVNDARTVAQSVHRAIAKVEPQYAELDIPIYSHTARLFPVREEHFTPAYFSHEDLIAFSTNMSAVTAAVERFEGKEYLDRATVNGMQAALRDHKDSAVAFVMESRTIANIVVNALRAATRAGEAGFEYIRWPSAYALSRRLKGFLVAAVEYDKGLLKATVRAR